MEDLLKELHKYPDGTRVSTALLLKLAGHEENFDMIDLFAIHNELFEAVKVNSIILDMSEHNGMVEGLPFNIDYIVHNNND